MSAVLQQRQGTHEHLLSVEEYHLLWEAGLLNEHIELIEGVIYDMAPIGGEHIGLTNLLTMALARSVDPTKWTVQVQSSIKLDRHSEPEPDICILNKSADELMGQVPEAGDIYLIIEVSHTTLKHDTSIKTPLYAKNGIPNYWVFDIKNKRLLIHSNPQDGRYQDCETIISSDHRVIEILSGVNVPVSEYLKKLK